MCPIVTHITCATVCRHMQYHTSQLAHTGTYQRAIVEIITSWLSRLTVVSREAKKKQHACASSGPRDHYSELFTRMAALKF